MEKRPFLYSLLLLLLITIAERTTAQKRLMYPVHNIPEKLLKNSNAVVRDDVTEFELINPGKAVSHIKMAITILNKKGDHYARISLGYDPLRKITNIDARSYDKTGRLIKVAKNKDIKDYSAFDGFSLFSDNRVKNIDLRYPDYPYTIVYEYRYEYDGILVFPGWVPYSGFHISSEHSSLVITAPQNYEVRYREYNLPPTAKETTSDDKKVISWKFGAFSALESESRMPYFSKIIPMVKTAPSQFEMEGYSGSMSDWQSFGKWEKLINKDRDILPDEYATKVKALVADEPSRTAKIKKIYEYLQANTRYVSVQLGIGGWQTFPASSVASNGYGDCKALSNYMKSMLKVVGIDSYYTLVRARSNTPNILTDFPSNQFNHMILCVPNYQDTIWLECTSQDKPFGYMGSFTGDRDVLVINDEGGKIVHTPVYSKENNLQNQFTEVALNESGEATITFTSTCSGLQYENYMNLLDASQTEQKKWFHNNFELPSFELMDYSFEPTKKPLPEITAKVNVLVHRFASASGKRLYLKPNIFNRASTVSIPQKERKYNFELRYPYIDTDTVKIMIPSGYHLEYIPEKVSIASPYGSYTSELISDDGVVYFIRKKIAVKGSFPAEQYVDYVKFINKIAVADKAKIVLAKST